ncbi:hypothetical protein HanIR_Chr05g0254001 [Helianthus annuus]|nr:hypothetical protein HanIR_Chr05g0254001 [Helianthus annuus]
MIQLINHTKSRNSTKISLFAYKKKMTIATFDPFKSSFALRASLITLSSFVFVARSTNWKSTFIASNKWLTINCYFDFITTNLAYLPT